MFLQLFSLLVNDYFYILCPGKVSHSYFRIMNKRYMINRQYLHISDFSVLRIAHSQVIRIFPERMKYLKSKKVNFCLFSLTIVICYFVSEIIMNFIKV